MASNVFPVAVASSSPSTIAQTFTATSANVMYNGTNAFAAGTYTITCAAGSIAVVDFWNGTTYVGSATTASGTVTFNLATAATRIGYYVNTGSSIVISATLTGNPVSSVTGTLDTITSSGTYTATGLGYVVAVGGGGGGAGGGWNNTAANSGGSGGGGGAVCYGLVTLTGSIDVTIGAAGSGGAGATGFGQNGGSNGTSGGTTIFGSLNAGGGATYTGGTATGGTINTTGGQGGAGASASSNGGNGVANTLTAPWVINATTGGGGGGTRAAAAGTSVTSGYGGRGVGGQGANAGFSGGNAGGSGTAGIVYVLRF